MLTKGIFISLEGIDGSGKSTLKELIIKELRPQYKVISVREPGGTFISEKIRDLLLDVKNEGIASKTEAFLYAAARAQLTEEVIKPALLEEMIVIADRFIDSTLAYQGFGRGLDIIFLQELNFLCTGGIKPDLTILLDLDPLEGQKRKQTDLPDRLEKEGVDFQLQVRKGYLHLASEESTRIKIIKAEKEKKEIKSEAMQYITDLIKNKWGKNELS